MGSSLSPIIFDLVMRDLEERVLETLNLQISCYVRYVDDIAMVVPPSSVNDILKVFLIDFHSITIYNLYHKPTFSGRYLSFLSQHPVFQKSGTIMGMVDRVFLLSHPRFHFENLKFFIEILFKNDYPLKSIFNTINSRLKFLLSNRLHRKTNNNTDKNCRFTIPFIQLVSNKFKHVIKDLNTRLSFFSVNKLDYIIKAQRILSQSNLKNMWFLTCNDTSYIRPTCRLLKTRISEHFNHIRRNTFTHSVITEQKLKYSHEFD